jgi:hypothetical protein
VIFTRNHDLVAYLDGANTYFPLGFYIPNITEKWKTQYQHSKLDFWKHESYSENSFLRAGDIVPAFNKFLRGQCIEEESEIQTLDDTGTEQDLGMLSGLAEEDLAIAKDPWVLLEPAEEIPVLDDIEMVQVPGGLVRPAEKVPTHKGLATVQVPGVLPGPTEAASTPEDVETVRDSDLLPGPAHEIPTFQDLATVQVPGTSTGRSQGKFICTTCGKRYNRKETMTACMDRHTGTKRFKCEGGCSDGELWYVNA